VINRKGNRFYANWWSYEVNIYVKVMKWSKVYKEKLEKWWYKEVKDLWDWVVLLVKKEKIKLEKAIITKKQAQKLKELLRKWKEELLEKERWLEISKAEIEKFKDEIKKS